MYIHTYLTENKHITNFDIQKKMKKRKEQK